jgi:hypothetical protein
MDMRHVLPIFKSNNHSIELIKILKGCWELQDENLGGRNLDLITTLIT